VVEVPVAHTKVVRPVRAVSACGPLRRIDKAFKNGECHLNLLACRNFRTPQVVGSLSWANPCGGGEWFVAKFWYAPYSSAGLGAGPPILATEPTLISDPRQVRARPPGGIFLICIDKAESVRLIRWLALPGQRPRVLVSFFPPPEKRFSNDVQEEPGNPAWGDSGTGRWKNAPTCALRFARPALRHWANTLPAERRAIASSWPPHISSSTTPEVALTFC